MVEILNSLPTVASIWIVGLVLLLGIATAIAVSLCFSPEYRRRGIVEFAALSVALVANAWIILGLPLTYIVGGSAASGGDTGGWLFIGGMLGLAFSSGIVGNALDIDDQWIFRPVFYSVLAGIPLLLIALAAGLIAVGVWFWLVLAGVIISIIGFLSWGVGGLIAAGPTLALLLIALIQS